MGRSETTIAGRCRPAVRTTVRESNLRSLDEHDEARSHRDESAGLLTGNNRYTDPEIEDGKRHKTSLRVRGLFLLHARTGLLAQSLLVYQTLPSRKQISNTIKRAKVYTYFLQTSFDPSAVTRLERAHVQLHTSSAEGSSNRLRLCLLRFREWKRAKCWPHKTLAAEYKTAVWKER